MTEQLLLPDMEPTDVGREEHVPDEEEQQRHATVKERIAVHLQENRERWVTFLELKEFTPRYSARIFELRNEGCAIDKQMGKDGFEYRWLGRNEMVKVTEDWQQAYYQSEHWRGMSRQRMDVDDYVCQLCGSRINLQVHHMWYDLFNEDIASLLTVCELCHEKIHNRTRIAFPATVAKQYFERLMPIQG